MGIGSYAPTAFVYICMGLLKPQHGTQPTIMAMMGVGVEEGTNAPPIFSLCFQPNSFVKYCF
jgi:hypothetical protein